MTLPKRALLLEMDRDPLQRLLSTPTYSILRSIPKLLDSKTELSRGPAGQRNADNARTPNCPTIQ